MCCTEKAHDNKHNWIYYFNKYICSIQMQYVNEVNTLLMFIKHVMNKLQTQWYHKQMCTTGILNLINLMHHLEIVEINYGHTDFLNMNLLLSHVTMIMSRINRSLGRFMCWVASNRIETGRYERNSKLAENRTCFHCIHKAEDDFHVLMRCTLYGDLHYELFTKASSFNCVCNVLRDEDKFEHLSIK